MNNTFALLIQLPRLVTLIVLGSFFASPARAQQLSPLATTPDWNLLEPYQETITKKDFLRLLEIYAPHSASKPFIEISSNGATIKKTILPPAFFELRFADSQKTNPLPRYWRSAKKLPVSQLPLKDVRIALDPGHIGGRWAKIEERWFQIGDAKPVMEGEMTLIVAQLLSKKLSSLGADISWVRSTPEPVTSARPEDLRNAALKELRRIGVKYIRDEYNGYDDPVKQNSIQWQSELLFYRTSEIRARSKLVNETLKPDMVICIHFNAEPWGNPSKPQLVDENHFHMLVNGCYSAGELGFDDVRFEMLLKLLNQSYEEEIAISKTVAGSIAKTTRLPPYLYKGNNAFRPTSNIYIWARNLMANRVYQCPVLYLEPYVMNNKTVFERIQMGAYEGSKSFHGKQIPNIYEEYAESVARGLMNYFREKRAKIQ